MLNAILATIASSSPEENRHHGLGALNRMSHRHAYECNMND
ncbi:unnamed protein product [Prunus armeniaca]